MDAISVKAQQICPRIRELITKSCRAGDSGASRPGSERNERAGESREKDVGDGEQIEGRKARWVSARIKARVEEEMTTAG